MIGQILLYHFTGERLAAVCKTLDSVGVRYRIVEESEYKTPIGTLLQLSVKKRKGPVPVSVSEEMMVLCGLDEDGLNRVLVALRGAGLIVAYKAILTPTNKDWMGTQLFAELRMEHEAMQKQRKK